MLRSSKYSARVARLTLLCMMGILISHLMGAPNSATIAVTITLTEAYCSNLIEARALLRRRLMMQSIGIAIMAFFCYLITFLGVFPAWLEMPLALVAGLPTLMYFNYRWNHMDFSEIGMCVIACIIVTSFPTNPEIFLFRLKVTTIAMLTGYFLFSKILYKRMDRVFDAQWKNLKNDLQIFFHTISFSENKMYVNRALLDTVNQQIEKSMEYFANISTEYHLRKIYKPYAPFIQYYKLAHSSCKNMLFLLNCYMENQTAGQLSDSYKSELFTLFSKTTKTYCLALQLDCPQWDYQAYKDTECICRNMHEIKTLEAFICYKLSVRELEAATGLLEINAPPILALR